MVIGVENAGVAAPIRVEVTPMGMHHPPIALIIAIWRTINAMSSQVVIHQINPKVIALLKLAIWSLFNAFRNYQMTQKNGRTRRCQKPSRIVIDIVNQLSSIFDE
jgi:hypothetical protein